MCKQVTHGYDLGVRDFWQTQLEALFDIKVIDTDAPSHSKRTPQSALECTRAIDQCVLVQ